jgi:hypothetical protein
MERERLKVKDSKRLELMFPPSESFYAGNLHRKFKGFGRKKSCIPNTAAEKNHT